MTPDLNSTQHSNNTTSTSATLSSFTYPIIGALLLPVLIGLFKPALIRHAFYLFYIVAAILPFYILFQVFHGWSVKEDTLTEGILRYIRPLPPGVIFGTDLKRYSFPWVTTFLVVTNTIIFYSFSNDIVDELVFFPRGNPPFLQIILSVFTSAFLHQSPAHLLGNMFFLWTFGSTIEPRIGSFRYLTLYFTFILASKIAVVSMLVIKSFHFGSTKFIDDFHSLGASGAIAGTMGIFVVRCFFARITVNFPFFLIPFISMPLKVQGTFLIGLFFAMDIAGSVKQFEHNYIIINYWAHVGGYLCGFVAGYLLKLHRTAASRESLEVKADRISKKTFKTQEAMALFKQVLDTDPENETALRYFLNLNRLSQKKAEKYYVRLMTVLSRKDFSKAVETFSAYYPTYVNCLPGLVLLKLGIHFYQNANLQKARTCLEIASGKEGPWQQKALLSLSKVFERFGNPAHAKKILEEGIQRFPDAAFKQVANERLAEIK